MRPGERFACFYLGTHDPSWLRKAGIPLFVSHRRLAGRKQLPPAAAGWALDSGGFSELSMYGGWRTTPAEYVAAVSRYDTEIGNLEWAAPQDWMVEPQILAKTGLTVTEHQHRTVDNLLELHDLWSGDDYDCPFIPVLQGWTITDYLRHADMYERAGVVLSDQFLVGIGSVCRRQGTDTIARLVGRLAELDILMHGFGVKTLGISAYSRHLYTSDSMAWSRQARWERPLPGHEVRHKNCANCLEYALAWRQDVLARVADGDDRGDQLELWETAS